MISIIIPCYGSQNTIEIVVDELVKVLKKESKYDYEIILINDGSPDRVFDNIKRICNQYTFVKGICLAKNFGQHAALMAGYRNCIGDIVISLDDDGQTPAKEIFKLIEKIEEGYDVVYATYDKKKHSTFRNIGSKINSMMMELLLNKPHNIATSSYFAAKKFVIDEMIRYKNAYPYVGGLVFRTTTSIANVAVNHQERLEGDSGYTLKKLLSLWLNGFTAFSVKPLRIATIIGILFSCLGFAYAFCIVINKILNPSTAIGWSSIMAALLVIGGLILFMLGLIGEYIGRIYISLNNAPQYVIREIIGIEKEIDG